MDYWESDDLGNLVGVVLLDEVYYLLDKPRLCLNYHQRLICAFNLVLPPVMGGHWDEVNAGCEFRF